MNHEKAFLAREAFLRQYPGGFSDPAMKEIARKHKTDKMYALTREKLTRAAFEKPVAVLEDITGIISQASVVSVFEKMRFRDFIKNCSGDDREMLVHAFYELVHGNREQGYLMFDVLLSPYQLSKWTLVSLLPAYYYPQDQVFLKPTTVKKAISYFEWDHLHYLSRPDHDFYTAYREQILELKKIVRITDDNLALGGFIMIAAQ